MTATIIVPTSEMRTFSAPNEKSLCRKIISALKPDHKHNRVFFQPAYQGLPNYYDLYERTAHGGNALNIRIRIDG